MENGEERNKVKNYGEWVNRPTDDMHECVYDDLIRSRKAIYGIACMHDLMA
jgi:hypothetical protein